MNIDINKVLSKACATENNLDTKKEQTGKKIEYVTSYVQEWIRVDCMSENVHTLNFVDGMSNAGIYRDGELGTAIRVFELFLEAAKEHPETEFNLLFNDLDEVRIRIFKEVCLEVESKFSSGDSSKNIQLYYSNKDINDFIRTLPECDGLLSQYGTLTLLFIDPYDARTVDVPILKQYIESHYCELFYNWFSSDHVRNPEDSAIRLCFSGLDIPPGRDAAAFIAEYLAGDDKAYFAYPFRNQNNAEIYQIIFITPHQKGLEKIKDALWATFDGEEYHRNHRSGTYQQFSMFDMDNGQELRKDLYGKDVQDKLTKELRGQYTYEEIKLYVLQRSMLKGGDVLKYVIKPLIENGKIKKLDSFGSRNYKKDSYVI